MRKAIADGEGLTRKSADDEEKKQMETRKREEEKANQIEVEIHRHNRNIEEKFFSLIKKQIQLNTIVRGGKLSAELAGGVFNDVISLPNTTYHPVWWENDKEIRTLVSIALHCKNEQHNSHLDPLAITFEWGSHGNFKAIREGTPITYECQHCGKLYKNPQNK